MPRGDCAIFKSGPKLDRYILLVMLVTKVYPFVIKANRTQSVTFRTQFLVTLKNVYLRSTLNTLLVFVCVIISVRPVIRQIYVLDVHIKSLNIQQCSCSFVSVLQLYRLCTIHLLRYTTFCFH